MNKLILAIYIALNSIAFLFYGIDKYKAVRRKWRVPEKHLILLSFFGPFGALIGMLLLRHKIRKPKFVIAIPVVILLHLLAYFYFFQ